MVAGTHLISESMSAALGDAVRFNAVVRTIRQDETGVHVEYEGGSLCSLRPRRQPGRRRRVSAWDEYPSAPSAQRP